MGDPSQAEYLRKISNPIALVSKTQRDMLGSYKSSVDRQAQSRQVRLRILAEKRQRVQSSASEDFSEESEQSDYSSASSVREAPFTLFQPPSPPPSPPPPLFQPPLPPLFQPPPSPPQTPPAPRPMFQPPPQQRAEPTEDPDLIRSMYEDELESRMQDLGIGKQTNESVRTQELRYWRKKVSLEEEAAVKQAGMLLSLLSSFVESFTNAIGFTTIRTQGLSEAIQTALEAGDFDLAIKSYCVSPQALNMLKNPVTSFMTSFGHVLLRTHIGNVKRELEEGIEKFNQKKKPPPRSPPPHIPNNNIPWDTRRAHVVDSSGHTRPAFKLDGTAKPCLSDTFRQQVSSMGPILNAMKQVANVATLPTNDSEEVRSGISLI